LILILGSSVLAKLLNAFSITYSELYCGLFEQCSSQGVLREGGPPDLVVPPGFLPEMNLRGIKQKYPLMMSFKHIRTINPASKCLKITHDIVIKFSKPENNFLQKLKLRGISPIPPLNHLRGDLSPSGGNPGTYKFKKN
jgi:hypothetical protein